ncbi:hypothetical protein F511_44062 [Dorcoceras hygrometricum]|uniref:Uncharacterized protein n=1 Tax=Dorcoceras hygrometricum TaxID=472368 RepID=A0A2Z6ZYU3_9LAMI|nr:hypothetical protein F511_44062 [Dorcoceras hygrometricum]
MALCDVVLVIMLLPAFSAFCSDFSHEPPFFTFEVALDSSWKALSSRTHFGGCSWLEQKHEVAVLIRAFRSCRFCAGRDLLAPSRNLNFGNCCSEGCEGERRYRTLISLLGFVSHHAEWLTTTVHGRGNGNPGFTAGRGFNPAGGSPGGAGLYFELVASSTLMLLLATALELIYNLLLSSALLSTMETDRVPLAYRFFLISIKWVQLELVYPLTKIARISQLTSQLVFQLVAQLSSLYYA